MVATRYWVSFVKATHKDHQDSNNSEIDFWMKGTHGTKQEFSVGEELVAVFNIYYDFTFCPQFDTTST